jgi:uncharacterized protein
MQTKSNISHLFIKGYEGNKVFLSNNDEIIGNFILYKQEIIKLDFFDIANISSYEILKKYNLLHKELLLIGCGDKFIFLNPALNKELKKIAYSIDFMTTINALHIFNLLLEEQRDVVGIFIN